MRVGWIISVLSPTDQSVTTVFNVEVWLKAVKNGEDGRKNVAWIY